MQRPTSAKGLARTTLRRQPSNTSTIGQPLRSDNTPPLQLLTEPRLPQARAELLW